MRYLTDGRVPSLSFGLTESLTLPQFQEEPFSGSMPERCIFNAENPAGIVNAFLERYPNGGVVLFSAHYHLDGWMGQVQNLSASRLAYVGARNATLQEAQQLAGIQRYELDTFLQEGIAEITFSLMEFIRSMEQVCVIVDLSVVDPSQATDVHDPVVAGMSGRALLFVLHKLRIVQNIKVLGVTGMRADARGQTTALASKVLSTFY